MRLFLAAHRHRPTGGDVPETGLLLDSPATGYELGLALDLVLERLLDVLEGVQVLDLGLGPERRRAHRPHRDVGVAAQAPLLHVAVVDANRHQNLAQPAEELAGLGGRAQIRFGHDLEERDTAAIEVQVGPAVGIGKAFVQGLAGVLFEVRPGDADAPRLAGHLILDAPAGGDGPFVLRDLVALREVRIEVVLAREDRHRIDLAVERVRDPDGELHDLAVQHRQRARAARGTRRRRWYSAAPRTGCCSRRRSSSRSAAARGFRDRSRARTRPRAGC